MRHFLTMSRVNRYFRRGLGAGAETAMRAHLAACGACLGRYRRHQLVETAVPEGRALAEARLWRAIEEGGRSPAPPRRALLALPLALAGAAALVLLAPRLRERPEALERGGGASEAPAVHPLPGQRDPGQARPVPVIASPPARGWRWPIQTRSARRAG